MKTDMIYHGVNSLALDHIPLEAKCVLDLGCGAGDLGAAVKKRQNCEVVGVTYSPDEAASASRKLDRVDVQDLNQFTGFSLTPFDCVICSHVLEHLNWPDQLLKKLFAGMRPGAQLVVILPNVLFWKQRWKFLQGHFRYEEEGILDKTHFRFFDWQGARSLILDSGFELVRQTIDGSFPMPGIRRVIPAICSPLDRVMARLFPGLLGYQFVFVCRKPLAN